MIKKKCKYPHDTSEREYEKYLWGFPDLNKFVCACAHGIGVRV